MKLRAILHRMHDPVTGNLRLTGAESEKGKYRIEGVVSALGVPPTPVSMRVSKPSNRYLDSGMDVPILVDRSRPTHFKINWDGVPSYNDLAKDRAQQAMDDATRLAQQMTTGTAPPPQPNTWDPSGAMSGFNAPGGLADTLNRVMRDAFAGANDAHVHMNSSFEVIHGDFNRSTAERAQAQVVAVKEIPLPGAVGAMVPGGILDLTLDVTRNDGSRYSAHARTAFSNPERRAVIATIGARLDVYVDPNDPAKVIIGQ